MDKRHLGRNYTLIKNCDISNAFVIFVCDANMVHENPNGIPYVPEEAIILFQIYVVSLSFFRLKAISLRQNHSYSFCRINFYTIKF